MNLAVRFEPSLTDTTERIAALLQEVGETHHLVYRIVDGDDPDWASWYADWLQNLSELPQLVKTKPVRSELVWLLVSLDSEYTATSPDTPWPQWYAERVLDHFGSATK
jgi:hypothetical protein